MNLGEETPRKDYTDLELYSGAPLTDIENKKLRRMLEADARMQWFLASLWIYSRATLIIVGSIFFVREWISDALQWLGAHIK